MLMNAVQIQIIWISKLFSSEVAEITTLQTLIIGLQNTKTEPCRS